MENNEINFVLNEIDNLRKNLGSYVSDEKQVQNIDASLLNIVRLLEPRPPVSENNFCPKCGQKLNHNNLSDYNDIDTNPFKLP